MAEVFRAPTMLLSELLEEMVELTVWCWAPALTFSVLDTSEPGSSSPLMDLTLEITRFASEPEILEEAEVLVLVFFISGVLTHNSFLG